MQTLCHDPRPLLVPFHTCLNGRSPEQWLEETNYTAMPHCDHFGTGYNLVCWMEENGCWPQEKPTVHSRNPAGRFKMQQAINREWERRSSCDAAQHEGETK